jgi:hypothetical protein
LLTWHHQAACNAFTASLDLPSSNQTSLTRSFVAAVGRLPTTLPTDTEPLLEFVRSFGTHFLSRVNLGGTAVETSVFARASFSKFEAAWGDKGIAKGAALSYMKSFEGKIDKFQRYYDAYMQFVGNRTSSSRTWVPSQPPSGAEVTDSALAWLATVNNFPAVIGHEVENITTVIAPQYFPTDNKIAAKKATLETYLFGGLYCKDLNDGVACTAPPRADRWLRTSPGKLSAMPNKRARTGAALVHGDEIIIPGGVEYGTAAGGSKGTKCAMGASWNALLGRRFTMSYGVANDTYTLLPPPPNATFHVNSTQNCAVCATTCMVCQHCLPSNKAKECAPCWVAANSTPPCLGPGLGSNGTACERCWASPGAISGSDTTTDLPALVGAGVLPASVPTLLEPLKQPANPNAVLMIGGSADGCTSSNAVQQLRTRPYNHWVQCSSMNEPRFDLGTVTLPVTMAGSHGKSVTILRAYAFGGRRHHPGSTPLNDCADTALSNKTEFVALNGTTAITCGGKAWMTPHATSWFEDTPMPSARTGVAAIAFKGEIFVAGGIAATPGKPACVVSNIVEVYTPGAWTQGSAPAPGTWRAIAPIPAPMTPRTGAQIVLAHGLLYLLAGFSDAANTKPVHDVAVFNTGEMEWTFGPKTPVLGFSGSGYSAAVAANAVGDPDAADGDAMDIHVFGGVSGAGAPVKSHSALRIFAPVKPAVRGVGGAARKRAAIRTSPTKTENAPPRVEPKPVATASGLLPVLPGVDFLGLGFDLVKANPLADASPSAKVLSSLGWSSMPVYDASCADCFASNTTLAGKWRVPDSVDVNILESCSMQTENRVVSSMRELQVAFDEYAFLRGHVGLGKLSWLVSARFMGGEEVKSSLKTEIQRGNSLLLGTARCESYRIGFTSVKSRKTHLWPSFEAAVEALPAEPPGALNSANDKIWLDFIARYGTHVPTSITMGARATQISVLEKAKLTEALTSSAGYSLGINVRILLFFGIGTSDYGQLTAHNDVEFDELVTANYTRCIPTCPPDQPGSNSSSSSSAVMNTSAWMADVSEHPSPIDVELMSITEFIREQLGNNSARAAALDTFFETKYCNYLPGCVKPQPELTVGPLDLLHAAEFTTSRTGAAIAAFDGQLWVAGGVDATGEQYPAMTTEPVDSTGTAPYCAYNTTEVLDLASSVWSSTDQSHSLNRTQVCGSAFFLRASLVPLTHSSLFSLNPTLSARFVKALAVIMARDR